MPSQRCSACSATLPTANTRSGWLKQRSSASSALRSRIGLIAESALVNTSGARATSAALWVSSTSEQKAMPLKRQPRWLGASPSNSTRALRRRASR
jgi:hypothetical protein